jgi:DNA-binding response OmpR family regulator
MPKVKILIIDDEPDIVETVSYMLKSRDYAVITALYGLEGLEKVRTERPDLILLDIMMPDISGYDVCIKLKSDDSTKNIPIIMVSAKSESEVMLKSMGLGAEAYILKPFRLSTLLDTMKEFINR